MRYEAKKFTELTGGEVLGYQIYMDVMDMIPPKWSDFDFYSRMWREKKEAFSTLRKVGKSVFELNCVDAFRNGVLCVVGALFCAIAGWGKRK